MKYPEGAVTDLEALIRRGQTEPPFTFYVVPNKGNPRVLTRQINNLTRIENDKFLYTSKTREPRGFHLPLHPGTVCVFTNYFFAFAYAERLKAGAKNETSS